MVTNLVILTPEQLVEIINNSVRNALAEQAHPQARQHAAHEYLNMVEAAQYLQIPQSTLYQFCATRRLPYVKRGKRNFFQRADLDAFMAADRRKSVKEMEEDAMNKMRKGGVRK